MVGLHRHSVLPEPDLPDVADLLAEGRGLASSFSVGPCPFLATYGVPSESAYKRRCMDEGAVMYHAQFGTRE
jgi:hypothetical protein